MQYKKSITYILLFTFLVTIINSFLIIYLIENNQIKNATIINELGQIRGGIQRYSKLKIFNEKRKADYLEKYLEKKFENIKKIDNAIPISAKDFFKIEFLKLKNNWEELKKAVSLKKIYFLSEQNWITADTLLTYLSKAMENKTQKILFLIIFISILTILTTLLSVFFIYYILSHNFNVKTLKNPQTNFYNIHHLKETLILLQNRYQRYSKTFAIFKISFKETEESKIKKIADILKNNLRKSDKIFHYKQTIIILFIEPEKMDLKQATKRIENLINKIINLKNSELILYNGEKIENLI